MTKGLRKEKMTERQTARETDFEKESNRERETMTQKRDNDRK